MKATLTAAGLLWLIPICAALGGVPDGGFTPIPNAVAGDSRFVPIPNAVSGDSRIVPIPNAVSDNNIRTLPDAQLTPGVVRPDVTAADLCPVAHTPALRNVPDSEKMAVYRSYGILPHQGYCAVDQGCEVDHLISLELGGANDQGNLWPQPYGGTPWNAHVKDKLENKLHALVCAGTVTLSEAQSVISKNWIAAYQKYVGPDPH